MVRPCSRVLTSVALSCASSRVKVREVLSTEEWSSDTGVLSFPLPGFKEREMATTRHLVLSEAGR